MNLFGITGGIGSGKSTVAHALEQAGYNVYYTDREAQRIMHHNPDVIKQIQTLFGNDIYVMDKIDKNKLAQLIFNNTQLKNKLNNVVHPAVINDIIRWADTQQNNFAFVESAIIFESGINNICTAVICITAQQELRIQRTMKRDNCTREQVIQRINNQISEQERIQKADFVANNDNNIEISHICLDILNFCRNFAN